MISGNDLIRHLIACDSGSRKCGLPEIKYNLTRVDNMNNDDLL